MRENVHKVVVDVLTGGDETILEYVEGVLEDDHFELGQDGEGVFEALGDVLVDSGCCANAAAAREKCQQIARQLSGFTASTTAAPALRALGGTFVMGQTDSRRLLHTEYNAKHMIQNMINNDEALVPVITEKEKQKLERRAAKDEATARAALAVHQQRADATLKGNKAVILRNTGTYGSKDLHLENFSVSNGGKELISDATVTLAFARRYGIIGRNGTGKTTLLRAMAAHELAGLPKNCQILHVEQEVTGDDTSALASVLACDTERESLLAEEREILKRLNKDGVKPESNGAKADAAPSNGEASTATKADDTPDATKTEATTDAAKADAAKTDAPKPSGKPDPAAADSIRLTVIYSRLHEIDADGAEARAAMILAGLSFTPEMQQSATKTFSGGWRMRIALAQALFVEPDMLLLDEPTNHLDLHAVLWLEDYLLRWPKTLILVSHAREFLNAVCTDILHLHSQKLTAYKGNFTTFERTMRERVRNAAKAAEAQEQKKAHVQAFIDKFRYNAKRASLVQSRIKALERMADVEVMERDPEYVFKFPEPDAGVSAPIIGFNDVDFNYPGGPTLFTGLNFGLDLESRFAIVGPNGIGKSTLLGLISGHLEPTKGIINRNPKVRLATFSQHHVDGLDLALPPLAVMLRAFAGLKEPDARAHLASFGISGPLALQPMYTLSGGQKSRVAFAKITFTKPHILLLDEPSNHLDIDAVDALIEGLATFKGGVLMVSHDQHLIESTVDELWMCEEGRVTPFHGTFEEYKARLRIMRKN